MKTNCKKIIFFGICVNPKFEMNINRTKLNRIFLSLIFCFSFHFAKAQLKDTFEKGSIVTIENNKIDGYIKTNDLSHLSSEICFKLAEEDVKYINYNTTQIKSYQTETGKIFDLLSIKINNNSKEIKVFASLILKGETSLYKTTYQTETFYIVVSKDKNFVLQNDELVFDEIIKYNYQGVLNLATEGFLNENYQKFSFKEEDFIKIISEYNTSNGCKSNKITYDEKKYSLLFCKYWGRF